MRAQGKESMGRRREEPLINVLISLPWWMSAIGVVVILVSRHVWLAWAEGASGMYAPIARQMHWLFYAMAGIFALGAFASLIRQRLDEKESRERSGRT